jgi:hypothetical protein
MAVAAHARLQANLARIDDAGQRRSYLAAVAGLGELEALWQAMRVTDAAALL